MSTSVMSRMELDDELSVRHHRARLDGLGHELEEVVFVGFGEVSVWGTPERMAEVLDEALTRVQSIIDARREESDR